MTIASFQRTELAEEPILKVKVVQRIVQKLGVLGVLITTVLLVTASPELAATPSATPSTALRTGGPSPTVETTPTEFGRANDTPHSRRAQDNDIKFERISLEQGLSQSSVYGILQDDKGFMWFGTQDGLNKYDGYNFTVHRPVPGDPNSLTHRFIWSIYQDQEGLFWIGTDGGGLDKFDRDTGQFVNYRHVSDDHHSLSANFVYSIYQDREGALWIGTAGGLDRYDRDQDRFIRYQHDESDSRSLSNNSVRSIYQDREGVLWIGTDDGLDRYDRDQDQFIRYQHDRNNPDSLSNGSVRSIYQDQLGVLWIGTDGGGLNRFDRSTEDFIHYQNDPDDPHSLSDDSVRAIYQDREGALWIGTYGGGLDRLDRDRGQFVHYQNDRNDSHSLSSDFIGSIYKDRTGTLWIGTHGGGINKLDRSAERFVHYHAIPNNPNSLGDNLVWSIHQDRERVLWIGTVGGLDRYDRDKDEWRHYQNDPDDPYSLSNNVVKAIFEDREGRLWIGVDGGRLERFDRSTERFAHYQTDCSDPIRSIYKDRDDDLWIGFAGGGLGYFDHSTGHFVRRDDLSGSYVWAIYQDYEGALWVGTETGLNRYDREKRQFVHYWNDDGEPIGLSSNSVLSIHRDRSGALWVGTFGGGLCRFDRVKEEFACYQEQDGLPNDIVYGILEDNQGYLWLSTNKGLSRFDPRAETFANYDVSDGLQSNEFDAGAYYQSSSGEMFFGGVNGFNAFYPERIQDNLFAPPVVLTSLTQEGVETSAGKAFENVQKVIFNWPDNSFEFEFTALNYRQSEKNQYAYMLESFDEDWNYVGTKRFGRYTNLPGGTYTLRIKGSNNDGVWNEEGVSIEVTIVPPFWETWWFRGIVALALVGGAAGGYRLRVKSIRAQSRELETRIEQRTAELRQEVEQRIQIEEALRQSEMEKAVAAERSRLARDLHDAVTQTLFSAGLIAEALSTSWESDRDEGRQLLKELRQLTRGALAEMRTLLLELRPAALVEASLDDLLRQLADATTSREGAPVTVTVEGQCALPTDVHIGLYRIAQESLNNVVKHARASQVTVSLLSPPAGGMKGGEGVELRIGDDGRGFDPDCVPPDRLGLNIMRERAQAIGATMVVESRPGRGTQIRVVWTEDE